MGPPNSVAIASPLPNSYFGHVYGALSAFPSSFQFSGQAQPVIPTANYDVDSTGRTLTFPVPHQAQTGPPVVSSLQGLLKVPVHGYPDRPGDLPSWWAARLGELRGRWLPILPDELLVGA